MRLLRGWKEGEYRCLTCDHVLEAFDGSFEILIRLTIQPERHFIDTAAAARGWLSVAGSDVLMIPYRCRAAASSHTRVTA